MKERDVKLLWGRAAGRCAICRCRLTQDSALANDAFPLGEHAHIVGEKETSPRGDSVLSEAERDGYFNRILLCPNDHTIVDKDVEAWPVELLHQAKAEHELHVESTLTTEGTVRNQADQLIYASVIDAAVEMLQLENFANWASGLLEPYWRWPEDISTGVDRFRQLIFVTNWPGRYPSLEVALDRASFELGEASALFSEYSEYQEGGFYVARKRFKEVWHEPEVYDRLTARFQRWSNAHEWRIFEACKALNWAREVWRGEVNPMWLATSGWFHLTLYPDMTLRYRHVKPRYTEEEKVGLLAAGLEQEDIRPPAIELDPS